MRGAMILLRTKMLVSRAGEEIGLNLETLSKALFTNYFFNCRGALKQLSSSTPAMTAQAKSPEPPSPKVITKEDKLPTTSKSRQKKFHRHFPAVDLEEKVLNCEFAINNIYLHANFIC